MNDYFVASNLTPHTLGRAEAVNAVFQALQAGFDKLPSELSLKQDRVAFCLDTGSPLNTYNLTPAEAPAISYVQGSRWLFLATLTNTGACVVNVSALGNRTLKRADGADLFAGDIIAGQLVEIADTGTQLRLVGYHGSTTAGVSTAAAVAAAIAATTPLIAAHAALTTTHGVAGTIVGTSDAQVLTNKTFSGGTFSGTIAGAHTLSGVVTFGSAPVPGTSHAVNFGSTSAVWATAFFDVVSIGTTSTTNTLNVGGGASFTGNVGFGEPAPMAQVEVYGAGQTVSALTDAGVTSGTLALNSSGAVANAGGAILFGNSQSKTGVTLGWAAIKGLLVTGAAAPLGDIAFSTRRLTTDVALTEAWRTKGSTGHILIGTTVDNGSLSVGGVIAPEANNTRDLGTTSFAFRTAYLGTSIFIGTTVNNGALNVAGTIMPEASGTRNIGSTTFKWHQGWFDSIQVSGGAIDGTPIGAGTASTGAFTNLSSSAAGTLTALGAVSMSPANNGVTISPTGTGALTLGSANSVIITGAGATSTLNNITIGGTNPQDGKFINLVATGLLSLSSANALTAHAGGGQASALQLTTNLSRLSVVASANDSVKLGASAAGQFYIVINDTATSAQVFGAGTDTINNVATATGVPLAGNKVGLYFSTVAGKWFGGTLT